MKQSQRIQLCKQYHNHPLKSEYERKKAKICKRKPFSYFLLLSLIIGPIVMFFVYGYLFIKSTLGDSFLIIILGIVNIFVGLRLFVFAIENLEEVTISYNKDSLKALEDEYEQKGLIEMTEHQLFDHECCEYDDYRYDDYVCCVTKQLLSNSEYRFCSTPGNCKYCKTFVSAYLGADSIQYWSYEFKK